MCASQLSEVEIGITQTGAGNENGFHIFLARITPDYLDNVNTETGQGVAAEAKT